MTEFITRGKLRIPKAFDFNGNGQIDNGEEYSAWNTDMRGNRNGLRDEDERLRGLYERSYHEAQDTDGDNAISWEERDEWLKSQGTSLEEARAADARQRQQQNERNDRIFAQQQANEPQETPLLEKVLNSAGGAVQGFAGIVSGNPMMVANGVQRMGQDDDHGQTGDMPNMNGVDQELGVYGNGNGGSNGAPTVDDLTASYTRLDPNSRLLAESEASKVRADPRDIEAQRQALAGLQRMGSGKYSAAEINGQRLLQQQAAQWEQGQREAIMQQMGERGLGGSGMETLDLLGAQQGSANRSAQQTLELQRIAAARALEAQQAAMSGAGQMREQGFSEDSYNASALDDLNRFNVSYQRQVDAINNGLSNAEADSRIRAEQQVFDNSIASKGMSLDEWKAYQAQRNLDRTRSDAKTAATLQDAANMGVDLYNEFKGDDSENSSSSPSKPVSSGTGVYENKNAYSHTDAPAPTAWDGEENAAGLGRWY